MKASKYDFQYCQKLVLLSEDGRKTLLAKRRSEADYNGVFSFVGGKMENTDKSIIDGLKREKEEEIGASAKINIYTDSTYNVLFRKANGASMILPHYLAKYAGGDIQINNDEYSEFRWIDIKDINGFEPKIETIPQVLGWAVKLDKTLTQQDFVELK